MTNPTILVEPLWVAPPNRVGPAVQPAGAPVIRHIPSGLQPTGYPWDASFPTRIASGRSTDTGWHGGPGIIIDTYV